MRRVRAGARRFANRYVYGRRRYQPIFQTLHRISLAGLNFANDDPRRNGEYRLFDEFAQAWSGRYPVLFDVGANVGDWTAEAGRRIPGARIYAFEPTSRYSDLAERVGSLARTYQLGFSDSEGEAEIYEPPNANGLASLYQRDLRHTGLPPVEPLEKVNLRRLDAFLAEEGVDAVDFLKLDVEGHELAVLNGAGARLEDGTIAAIQFEVGGTYVDARVFLRDVIYLLADRYDIFRLLRDGLAPLRRWRESDEIFVYANYLALLRER